jgi:DNA polymerase
MGPQKFYDRCLSNVTLKPHFDSGEYTFSFVEKLIKSLRIKYSKIPAFWTNIEKAFRWVVKYPHERTGVSNWINDNCLQNDMRLQFWNDNGVVNIQLPSTRCLKYPQARIIKDKWNGKLKYKKYYLWGGAITENVVQAIARDIFVEGVLRLDAAGVPVILRSHDEVVILLSEKDAEKKLQKAIDIFCHKPSWAQDLCITGEGELTKFYKK